MKTKQYLIIGNSAAAVGCVEGIRRLDKTGAVTVVSQEPHHTYARPLISYLLAGQTDRQRMRYRGADFYETHGVTPLLGRAALSLDPAGKTVALDDGRTLPYDKLLVATGSAPFVPPMEGLDAVPKKFTFLSLDDADALAAAVTADSRVLIVGAGLIGLKCAEGLSGRAASLTVVDLAPQILPSVLDERAAALVQAHIERQGVRFLLSVSVARFEAGAARLTDGTEVPFDVLVLAVGVRPRVSPAREAGAAVGRGLITDEYMRTNLPDVYAAGDCTESLDITSGERKPLALLPNAYLQGETAGLHMAGGGEPFCTAMPMNAVGFWGLHIVSAGSYAGDAYVRCGEDNYRKLVRRDNLLRGFILIGDVLRAGIYTALIRDRVPLDTIDFDLIKDKPGLIAFSRRDRQEKLGVKPA
ncbi:MAG: FAD-dependent oxidoreductase [Oscillospiraceae bacterium]|jgi:NAD(P)H-nitrite reductase large subunit|nr:FAD-dependent oxidoreductase [Oscillospiraceae bacterium]